MKMTIGLSLPRPSIWMLMLINPFVLAVLISNKQTFSETKMKVFIKNDYFRDHVLKLNKIENSIYSSKGLDFRLLNLWWVLESTLWVFT